MSLGRLPPDAKTLARMRRHVAGFVSLAAVCAIVACTGQRPNAPALAPVVALPSPSPPPWILSVSPTDKADTLAQIRVIFAKPVTAVEELSGAGPRAVLDHISIQPQLGGHFAVLTPRMIGFVPDRALPIGTRVAVTLSAGLRDLSGDVLDHDLAWTFATAPVELRDLPQLQATDEGTPAPVGLRPTLQVTTNAAVDAATLSNNATLEGGGDSVNVTATLHAQPTPIPGSNAQELFDPSLDTWVYDLKPARDLHGGTEYALKIAPGVRPSYGNLATTKTYAGGIRTYGPLGIVPTPKPSPNSGGRFADGDPAIAFTNPIDPKSIIGAVTVSPGPAKIAVTLGGDTSNVVSLDPYALDPDKTYVATVAAGVKDIFGQRLGQDQKVTIQTSNFSPGAWSPSGLTIIPAGSPIALNFYATNLPGNRYQAAYARYPARKMLDSTDALTALPPPKSWPSRTLAGARTNQQSVVRVPLAKELGGPFGALAYGFRTALDSSKSAPGLTGIVQLTNLGVFAQWFPSHGTVLVQHLNDGAPVRSAAVAVYRIDESNKVQPQQCASGTTDAGGRLEFRGVDVERCAALASANQAPSLGFVVTSGADMATLTVWSWSGISRFDVTGGWTSGAPLSRGTILTDRQMYQPGERGELTGIAYYVSGERVVADAKARYAVKLTDPNNNSTKLGTVQTDAYGVFSLPVTFAKQQALGYYTVDAKGINGNDIGGSLRVAEFKPPNFKLTLSLNAKSATAGSSIQAQVAADYLFGAPLQGGTAHAYVTRDVATVQPKGWDDYWFGRQWFWPEQTPTFDSDVLQRDLALDAQGKTSLDVAVPSDLGFPMTYRVDMETSDVSRLSVSDSQSFLALPSDAIIGLASDIVGKAGAAMPIRVIVTDADGKPVSGRGVHVEMQKMNYTSATQEVEGGENAQQAIEYQTVATADTTSSGGPVTVQLAPRDAGAYRVVANFAGAKDDASSTDTQVFAYGAGQADWGLSDPNAVAVKLDKKQYGIGQTATAMIASPYDDADVYLAIVRGDTIESTILRGVHGAVHYTFRVTPAMQPNAAIQAVVVRRGAPKRAARSDDTLAVTGMSGFNVDLGDRYLKLSIAPQNATVTPGGPQHLNFAVTDRGGAPARGEVVAMVVNDAILQLTGYRLPDLVQTVFAAQPIATIFSDNRQNVTLVTQTPVAEKGFGYGGGFLAGAAGTRVRANFLPLAYYGVLPTDASGKAHADFTMPDDLTTWRVMAVALGPGQRFATADNTFVANQPLILNPLLPQFARPGDRFDLGVSAANQTGAAGALQLVLQLSGALAFAQGDPHTTRTTEQAATGIGAFRYPVITGTPGPTQVQAEGRLGDKSDAFKVGFEARNRAVTESVIETGVTRDTASVPLDAGNGAGSLEITLANSIVPQFSLPAQSVMADEGLPLADEAASRLVIASALQGLQKPYRLTLNFDPTAAVADNLSRLMAFQRGDGGFGEFAHETQSDPFVSAAAFNALAFAKSHGVRVDTAAMGRTASFLRQALANPGRVTWCRTDQCKAQLRFEALWALSQQSAPRTDFLADIVAASNDFDSATQIRLARYLLRAPGWQGQGASMASRLEQSLYVTGRYVVSNVSSPWSWLGSLVEAQSQMLQLMIERRAPAERLDGAVRALTAQGCRCGWPFAGNAASALTALTAYAAISPPQSGRATVSVGSTTIGSADFGSTASSKTFTASAASLPKNQPVTITASGIAHYVVLYTYPVAPDAPGQLAAFRVVRTLTDVSAAGSSTGVATLTTMDLAPAPQVQLGAGRVFDVGVRAIVDHPVDRFVIEDPLPAGFEAVDTTFRTSLQALVPQSNSWQIDATQIYRDRIVAYAGHLEPGVYDLHYLVRSVTPGTFAWPGARAYVQDAPEQFGRSAGSTLQVTP